MRSQRGLELQGEAHFAEKVNRINYGHGGAVEGASECSAGPSRHDDI